MKDLTYKEFLEAPHTIQFLYTMAMAEIPTGSAIIERGIKEHPEYFPDIIEHRKRWASIPQEVHDAVEKETAALKWPGTGNKGLVYYMKHPEESPPDNSKEFEEYWKKRESITNKHYDKYLKP